MITTQTKSNNNQTNKQSKIQTTETDYATKKRAYE